MLAYVFWHWPRADTAPDDYERDHREFHAAIGASRPVGFHYSTVFRVQDAPWLGGQHANYVDWYVVADSAALDPLNDVAVTGARKPPHDNVARASEGSAGGLLRLYRGDERAVEASLLAARRLLWLGKTRGTGYDEFYARLQQPWLDAPGVSLWRRQMVLGPTTEFGLLGADALPPPPADLLKVVTPLERIWP